MESNAPGGECLRFLKMGGSFLGHSLIIIKFSQNSQENVENFT